MSDGRAIMLGTAGHVDHGKTALVKLLTGCQTDRLKEEQQRGLTIELGFAPCRLMDESIVGIVDVPGHVDFIHNMVAGAHGIDVVILVVAADDGVMPQTLEHLDILTLMGCRAGVIALTKVDKVDAVTAEMAAQEVRAAVAGTFLADAAICPVSNITGQGHEGLFDAMNAAVATATRRAERGVFRLWVERAFSVRGFGAVASGIPSGGQVSVGDRLELLPGGQSLRVRGIEVYGQSAQIGQANQCVALNLDGVEAKLLARGQVVAEPEVFASVTMAEAELHLLERLPGALKDYAEVHVHVGTAEVMTHLAVLDGSGFIRPGQTSLVQLRLAETAPLGIGERFVIRGSLAGLADGRVTTLGGGRIVDVSDVRLRRGREWTLKMLTARAAAMDDDDAFVEAVLGEQDAPIDVDALVRRAHLGGERVAAAMGRLIKGGRAMNIAGGYVGSTRLTEVAEAIEAALAKLHDEHPGKAGFGLEQVAESAKAPAGLLVPAIAELERAGRIRRVNELIGLAGRQVNVSDAQRELAARLEAALAEAGLNPPLPGEWLGRLRAAQAEIDAAIEQLCQAGRAMKLDEKVVMSAAAVEAARAVAVRLFSRQQSFTTMEYRDALGVSRKYAVPLLDYFDKVKLTVRSGNRRRPGVEARRLMQKQE